MQCCIVRKSLSDATIEQGRLCVGPYEVVRATRPGSPRPMWSYRMSRAYRDAYRHRVIRCGRGDPREPVGTILRTLRGRAGLAAREGGGGPPDGMPATSVAKAARPPCVIAGADPAAIRAATSEQNAEHDIRNPLTAAYSAESERGFHVIVNSRCVSGARTPIWDQVFTMTSVTDGFKLCRARIRSRRGMSVPRASLPAEPGGVFTQIAPKACCARLQKRYSGRPV